MINKVRIFLNKLSPAKKSALVFMIGSYIQYAISFLVTPVFSRVLSKGEFGLVTTFNSWSEMIGPIATLSLYAGYFNVGMVDYEEARDSFASSMLGLSFVSAITTMTVFVIINCLFPKVIGLPVSLIILMIVYYLVFPATRYWMARERFEYRYKKLFLVTTAIAIGAPAGGLACVFLSKGDLGVARLYGTNIIHFILGIVFISVLLGRSKQLYNKARWKAALSFSVPLIPHYLAMHILAASDRVMINSIVGNESAATYGMAYTAATVVTAAWSAINGSLTPYAYSKIKDRDFKPLARTAMTCIIGFSVLCLLICIIAPEVIMILGGQKYYDSIRLLPPLLAAVVFMEMYNLFSLIEFYNKKTKLVMLATVAAAVINLGLNYICIKLFGYEAAAYTTLICYVLYCLFHYINMRHIEKEMIYNPNLLIGFSVVYVSLCFACLLIYNYPFIRYGILLATLIVLFIMRKAIIGFYKQLTGA